MAKYVLGIDLGSTNSCFSVMKNGDPEVITNAEGNRTTPSVVSFSMKDSQILVGDIAKRQAICNSKNTIYTVKRLIGRKFSEVLDYVKLLPYEVVEASNGDCRVKLEDGRLYSPEELSSFILKKLKKDAEAYTGEVIDEAVITVPAYFNDSQRASTKCAGEIAGLKVLRIINEPTASSLAYYKGKLAMDKKVAVYDFGGSTFDISILDIADGVVEVLATAGDVNLGGDDIDRALLKHMLSEFMAQTGLDISKDATAIQRLRDEAEKCKITLSGATTYDVNLPFLTSDASGPKHLQMTISQATLEQLAQPIIDRSIAPCEKCLKDSKLANVDEVILVGGMTRSPLIVKTCKRIFNLDPGKSLNPDESVSLGAAVQGSILKGETSDILLLDVTPLTLSIETLGGLATPMIERNTTIPTRKSQTFSTAADNQEAVTVNICQGERKAFQANKLLGTFNLEGIPPARRGVPKIEISYDIDANGILKVTAKDLASNKEQKITITSTSGLSQEEIEKAKQDAEAHAAEDNQLADIILAKNTAETLVYASEKTLSTPELKAKLSAEVQEALTKAIAEVKVSLKETPTQLASLKEKITALEKITEDVDKAMYQEAPQPNRQADGQPASMDDVVDAEMP